jgi:hypothetical protein
MAFLKPKSELERTEADLAFIEKKAATLQSRLAEATRNVDALSQRRRQAAVDNAPASPRDAEAFRAGVDEREILRAALDEVTGKVELGRVRLAELRDAAERKEAADQITVLAENLAAKVSEFQTAGAGMLSAAEALAARGPATAEDFLPRVKALVAEIPAAIRELADRGRHHAAEVAIGAAPIRRPSPAPPPPEQPAPAIERKRIFLKQDSLWHDNGVVCTGSARTEQEIPIEIANAALASGVKVQSSAHNSPIPTRPRAAPRSLMPSIGMPSTNSRPA